jgi:2-aminoadipate transaminase
MLPGGKNVHTMLEQPHPQAPVRARLSQRAAWAGGNSIINALMARTLAHPNLISLAAGFVDQESLPVEPTQRAFAAMAANPQHMRAALQYGTTIGYPPLREAIAARLLAADGVPERDAAEVSQRTIVTAGSNELLYLASDCLLDPGDIVLCAAPTYFVYLGTLANLGARAIGVASDAQGIIPEALEEHLARCQRDGELARVKAIYVTTWFDNPRGVSVSADRRAALVDIAKRWSRQGRIYVIEDAAYRELQYDGSDDPGSLWACDAEGDTVIHAGTFSKSFSPGIRIGWGVVPADLLGPILSAKGHVDFGTPNFNQHLMHEIIRSGDFDAHTAMLRDRYRAKRAAMLSAAEEHLRPICGVRWAEPGGGLYLWLELPDGLAASLDSPLFDRALSEGTFYIPGEHCYAAEGEPRHANTLRLTFGIPSCESIQRGVAALARALRTACAP